MHCLVIAYALLVWRLLQPSVSSADTRCHGLTAFLYIIVLFCLLIPSCPG